MILLLNKKALQTNVWGSAVSYFKRVLGNIEIVPMNTVVPKRNWLKQFQYSIESKSAGAVIDKVSFFEKKMDALTESIILNLSCSDIEGLLREYPGKEIWAVEYHGKNVSFFEGYGIGYFEIASHADTIRVDLVKYDSDNKRHVVESAFYNPHFSACRNFQKMLSTMPKVIVKNIVWGRTEQRELDADSNIGEQPFLKYLTIFYFNIIKKYWAVIANKVFGYYNERWTVAIGQGRILQDGLNSLHIQKMPNGEFWADPFIVEKGGNQYLFFERFPFDKKKGIISVGDVKNGYVHNVRDIIEQPYHLSYPNVFEEDGIYYMIPECSANNRVEIYKSVEFPDKWELFSSGFEGESLVDTCYYKDENGQRWLMASCSWNNIETHNEVFNIYQIDSLRLKKITPHKLNPIFIDSRKGRNGGHIFMEKGKPIRSAQDNRRGKYGHGVSLQQIDTLNINEYLEHPVASVLGCMVDGFDGTHQLCQAKQSFVIDLRK